MDVLNPKILVIDGRRYRLNPGDCCLEDCNDTPTTSNNEHLSQALPPYVERDGEIIIRTSYKLFS